MAVSAWTVAAKACCCLGSCTVLCTVRRAPIGNFVHSMHVDCVFGLLSARVGAGGSPWRQCRAAFSHARVVAVCACGRLTSNLEF